MVDIFTAFYRYPAAPAPDAYASDATFVERKAALRAGYPFRKREGYPYKVWLDAQKAYLARHDDRPLTPEIAPLFFAEAPEQ